ncbi:hypothetical protein NPIL_250161 [Nephila pilipes]|uniref:Uncharacterized protein n=1 Tax=Nephila pilipes TaxID=299642 RepID=A0A8X6NJ32_NEPPI|nr:hypothetical protein NPIL_250161 [Nephila pilipes]
MLRTSLSGITAIFPNLCHFAETTFNTGAKTASNRDPYATRTVTKIDSKTTREERRMNGNNNKQMKINAIPNESAASGVDYYFSEWQKHKLPRSFLKKKNQNKGLVR